MDRRYSSIEEDRPTRAVVDERHGDRRVVERDLVLGCPWIRSAVRDHGDERPPAGVPRVRVRRRASDRAHDRGEDPRVRPSPRDDPLCSVEGPHRTVGEVRDEIVTARHDAQCGSQAIRVPGAVGPLEHSPPWAGALIGGVVDIPQDAGPHDAQVLRGPSRAPLRERAIGRIRRDGRGAEGSALGGELDRQRQGERRAVDVSRPEGRRRVLAGDRPTRGWLQLRSLRELIRERDRLRARGRRRGKGERENEGGEKAGHDCSMQTSAKGTPSGPGHGGPNGCVPLRAERRDYGAAGAQLGTHVTFDPPVLSTCMRRTKSTGTGGGGTPGDDGAARSPTPRLRPGSSRRR